VIVVTIGAHYRLYSVAAGSLPGGLMRDPSLGLCCSGWG
jgi:hypothetical protein